MGGEEEGRGEGGARHSGNDGPPLTPSACVFVRAVLIGGSNHACCVSLHSSPSLSISESVCVVPRGWDGGPSYVNVCVSCVNVCECGGDVRPTHRRQTNPKKPIQKRRVRPAPVDVCTPHPNSQPPWPHAPINPPRPRAITPSHTYTHAHAHTCTRTRTGTHGPYARARTHARTHTHTVTVGKGPEPAWKLGTCGAAHSVKVRETDSILCIHYTTTACFNCRVRVLIDYYRTPLNSSTT